ncbi:putative phospholipid:diacylglycerol acyltransferase 2 [Stylosanthes scabra]|uniref:Phospholipid:diacylglycerol acyltransferase 2 n=1 Tax=Stylosanthes scabra TaxID=79078 RepID=A0ABU6U2T9_9FABA|nr:putative phospholipid:diacylglycerol acyltransferase 2 [Stylosanthes scabra]
MERAKAHFSHGIAENIDDPKYSHYRYWSNPLETKLPNAPDMEIYCLYGVGIPTKRSYVYNKLSTSKKCKTIPFRMDASANGGEGSCLQNGVHFVDDDESVPVLSSGFMCAKGWRGITRFNPSGMTTYIREYRHIIMGNVALVEDVLRVAAGATGEDIGGDRIFSDIMRMSERINLRL